MPQWREMKRTEVDGVSLVVKERWDRRNRQGATEYFIEAEIDGKLVHYERHSCHVWLGHCSGQLLLPLIAARAKAQVARAASQPGA